MRITHYRRSGSAPSQESTYFDFVIFSNPVYFNNSFGVEYYHSDVLPRSPRGVEMGGWVGITLN